MNDEKKPRIVKPEDNQTDAKPETLEEKVNALCGRFEEAANGCSQNANVAERNSLILQGKAIAFREAQAEIRAAFPEEKKEEKE